MDSNGEASQATSQLQITNDFIDSLKRTYPSRHYRRDGPVSEESFLEILKEQLLLVSSLKQIKLEVKSIVGQVNASSIQAALHEADTRARKLHNFIKEALGGDPLLTSPSNASAMKADQVFDTAELAEMIFMELEARDVLVASQVNKAFRAGVAGSSKLQIKLCYRGDPDSLWRSSFNWCLGYDLLREVRCTLNDDRALSRVPEERRKVQVEATLKVAPGRSDGVGRFPLLPLKYHAMLICQPPIKEMLALPQCCDSFNKLRNMYDDDPRDPPDPPGPVVMRSSTGLTVGDLLRVGRQLYADHRYCPYANERLHDQHGNVHSDVEFIGTLTLQEHDPEARYYDYSDYGDRASPDEWAEEEKSCERQAPLVEQYYNAKRYALEYGYPILTMAEWEAAQHDSVSQDKSGGFDNPEYRDDNVENNEQSPNAEEGADNHQGNEYSEDHENERYESDPDFQEDEQSLFTEFPVPWWLRERFGVAPENGGEKINGESGDHE